MKRIIGAMAGALIATSSLVSPAVAQSQVAPMARASAEVEGASELRGGYIIPLIAVVALILIVVVATGGDDGPSSP